MRPNALEVALGNGLEWSIQSWVSTTGRKVRIAEEPWLEGPVGNKYIGAEFYEGYASEVFLDAVTDDENSGLLPNFSVLAGEGFDPSPVHPKIRDFYERTARYDLFAQIDWSGPFKLPPRTLIYLVGRNVGQFDIPPLGSGRSHEERADKSQRSEHGCNVLRRLAQALGGHWGGHARRPVYHLRVACRAAGTSRASTRFQEDRRPRSSAPRTVRTAPSRSSQMAGASGRRATTGSTARTAARCASSACRWRRQYTSSLTPRARSTPATRSPSGEHTSCISTTRSHRASAE